MKSTLLIVILSLFFVGASCQIHAPEMFARSIFDLLKFNLDANLEEYYATKKEFIEALDLSDNAKLSNADIGFLHASWDESKETFFENFEMEFHHSIQTDWATAEVDSITYDYLIPNPSSGMDEYIAWPQSKSFEINASKLAFAEINVYFFDSTSLYQMTLFPVYVGNSWKFVAEGLMPKLKKIE